MSLLKKNLILALILLCCLPLKAQIILNEVMPKPASAANACDQTMAGSTGCGREYVEIYNNSDCPVDISCYILASATDPTVKGSFSFPAGTIIGARQHFVLGGPNASATAGSVDFVLNSYVSTSQMCIGSARWFLENTDGWVALYAPDGSVADAIYWTFSAGEASKLNTEPEFNEAVCLPVACGPNTLLRANQMGGSITYVGQVPGVGLTFSRRPNDGGAWQRDVAPSIASNCNGTCIPVAPSFTVTGVITPNTTCTVPYSGSIDVTVTPAGSYTYSWAPGGETTQDLTELNAGTYTVTVTNTSNGCTATRSFVVTNNVSNPVLSGTTTPASCGQNTGAINLSVSGGTMPYSYSWAPNGEITEDLSGLAPGAYTVTVTGANGCSQTASFNVANNNVTINLSAVTTPNTACQAPFNGAINLSVSPAGTYTYLWDPNGETSQDLSALQPGAYTVTVTASPSGCTASATYTVTDNPNIPSLSGSTSPASCGQPTGAINLSVSSGVMPYSYSWDPNGEITEDLSGLAPGAYTVTVTGANGCSQTTSFNVANNNVTINLSAVTTPNTACQTPFNGAINLSVSPAGTYTYLWDPNGETSQDLSALEPGAYTVTVTASPSGCTASATYTVTDNPNRPSLSGTTTPASCGQPTGAINLSVSGGVMPYSYLWDPNGEITEDLSGLAPGAYTVTVTGANGCTQTTSFNVANNNVTINLSAVTTPNTACQAPFNGAINLSVSPAGTYTYLWDPNGETSQDLSALEPGAYTVTVTASPSGCTASATYTVTDNPNRPSLSGTTTPASCGQNTGAINLSVSGGVMPYSYSWDPNGEITEDLSGLAPGAYTVTVTGANGCTQTASFNVANNNVTINLSAATTPNTACTAPFNGSINLSVSPAGSYSYQWDPNGETSQDLSALEPGAYTVTVTASPSGCTASATYTVTDNPNRPSLTGTTTPASCGQSNGAINTTVTGGATPFNYLWAPNSETTPNLTNIQAGTYTLTVTGSNGCTTSSAFNISNSNSTFSISATTGNNTNCQAPFNGNINLSVTPVGSYTYLWDPNGASSQDLSGQAPGTYTVTVTDAISGCNQIGSYTINDAPLVPLATGNSTPSTCNTANGSIDLTVSGGVSPYTYLWLPNGEISQDLSNINAGLYTVTVSGNNGCTTSTQVSVTNTQISLSLSGIATPNTNCTTPYNGGINLSVLPTGNYTYEWSAPGAPTTQNLSALNAGTYTVTVTHSGSCTASASYVVSDGTALPTVTIASSPGSTICNGLSATLTASGTAGQYNWSQLPGNPDPAVTTVTPVTATTYTVTVTTTSGCSSSASILLNVNNLPNPTIQSNLVSCGQFMLQVIAGANDAVPYSNYSWSAPPGGSGSTITTATNGVYTVTVSDANGCSQTASSTILVPAPLVINCSPSPSTSIGGSDGAVNITVSNGQPAFTYQLNNASPVPLPANGNITGLAAGSYSITVTDGNGCTDNCAFNINDPSCQLAVSSTAVSPSCNGLSDGQILLNIINATATPTINWGSTPGNGNNPRTNIPAGSYIVTVTSGLGCSVVNSVTISQPDALLITGTVTNLNCNNNNTGQIDLIIQGGSPAYTINWGSTQGSGSDPRINLPAGTFTVTVTDNNNCPAVASFTLTQPPALNISCSATAVTLPSGNDGTASVVVSGGSSGYTYLWNTGAAIPNISGLLPGTYCVTVTDALGCTASCCASVTGTGCTTAVGTMGLSVLSACSPDCITATYNNSNEVTDANDIVQFVLHTGSGNNIMGEISRNSTPAFCFNPATMVFGTTYYISAVAGDALPNGNVDLNHPCTQISVGTPVVYYQTPTATIVPPAQISCSNPVITLNGSNSTGNNITYSWAASVGGNIVGASNLSSAQANAGGNYQLTVAAPGGCSATASVQVANISNTITATIIASPSNIINCTVASVTLTANTTGLSGTPSYEWRNSDGILLSQNANFTLNSDGVISLIVVDMLTGCSDSDQITIIDNSQYPPLLASPPALITCNTPSITLTGSSLAGNTIQLAWATISGTDTLLLSSTGTAVTSTPGIYHLIGVDPSNGCTNAISVQVNQNTISPVAAIGPASNIDCQNTPVLLTGSATGASGSYSYQWATSNGNILSGANTSTSLVNQAGSYQITVTDNINGCTDTEAITLTAAQAPTGTLSINQPACTGDDGSILITVQGGTAPYHFSLNGGTETSQNLFNNLNPGNYDVVITDANDCSFLVNGTITPPLDFNIQLPPTITIKSGLSTTLEVEANVPNSQISSVQWSPSTGLSCDTCLITEASPERSILYSVVVVTSEGCRDQATVQIKVEDIGIYAPNILNYEDATNSSFTIYTEPGINLSIKTLQVFSRWGEKVFEQKNFEPNNPSLGWKGEFEGKKMDPAVFVWYAVVILPGNREVLLSGDITVVK